MFDFTKKTLTLDGQVAPIKVIEVGYYTPWGLMSTLDSAVEKCSELDMDPTLVVQPVVVFKDAAGRSEIFMRH